jgi:hypothetical protein
MIEGQYNVFGPQNTELLLYEKWFKWVPFIDSGSWRNQGWF